MRHSNGKHALTNGEHALTRRGAFWFQLASARRRLSLPLVAEPQQRDEHERKRREGRGYENGRRQIIVKKMRVEKRPDIIGERGCQIDDGHQHGESKAFSAPRTIIGGKRQRRHGSEHRRKAAAEIKNGGHDKAYTAVSFKNDTLALAERAKGEDSIAPLAKLPHVMFFGGGVVIKLGDEVIGSIGAAGAPGGKLDDGCAKAGLEKIRDRLK